MNGGRPRGPWIRCKVPNCNSLVVSHTLGYCGKHQARWYRWGDHNYVVATRPPRITREFLVEAIKPIEGHTPSLDEIGRKVGVTRERIRQRLAEEGLQKISATPKPEAHCPTCGSRRNFYRKTGKRHICRKCNPPKVYHVICGSCGGPITLTQQQITSRTRPHPLRPEGRKTPFFCNKQCSGRWAGLHYGWGTLR